MCGWERWVFFKVFNFPNFPSNLKLHLSFSPSNCENFPKNLCFLFFQPQNSQFFERQRLCFFIVAWWVLGCDLMFFSGLGSTKTPNKNKIRRSEKIFSENLVTLIVSRSSWTQTPSRPTFSSCQDDDGNYKMFSISKVVWESINFGQNQTKLGTKNPEKRKSALCGEKKTLRKKKTVAVWW